MAHSQAAKAQTHKRILRVAAERLRQTGIDRLSIADLMKEAGLTVGGFYKHFRSRDDLVVEALGSVLGGWERELDESPTEPDEHYPPQYSIACQTARRHVLAAATAAGHPCLQRHARCDCIVSCRFRRTAVERNSGERQRIACQKRIARIPEKSRED
jgi:AcrR family transcriptional regulator